MKRSTNKTFIKIWFLYIILLIAVLAYIALLKPEFIGDERFIGFAGLITFLLILVSIPGPVTWVNSKIKQRIHGRDVLHKKNLIGWEARMTRFLLIDEDFD